MWGKAKRLENEVSYLRGLVSEYAKRNRELVDQLIAMKNLTAYESLKMNGDDESEVSQGVDLLGMVQDLEPKTPEEKEHKKLAELQIQNMMGANVPLEI